MGRPNHPKSPSPDLRLQCPDFIPFRSRFPGEQNRGPFFPSSPFAGNAPRSNMQTTKAGGIKLGLYKIGRGNLSQVTRSASVGTPGWDGGQAEASRGEAEGQSGPGRPSTATLRPLGRKGLPGAASGREGPRGPAGGAEAPSDRTSPPPPGRGRSRPRPSRSRPRGSASRVGAGEAAVPLRGSVGSSPGAGEAGRPRATSPPLSRLLCLRPLRLPQAGALSRSRQRLSRSVAASQALCLSPPSAASASPPAPSGQDLWPRELERPLSTGGRLEAPQRETAF